MIFIITIISIQNDNADMYLPLHTRKSACIVLNGTMLSTSWQQSQVWLHYITSLCVYKKYTQQRQAFIWQK